VYVGINMSGVVCDLVCKSMPTLAGVVASIVILCQSTHKHMDAMHHLQVLTMVV